MLGKDFSLGSQHIRTGAGHLESESWWRTEATGEGLAEHAKDPTGKGLFPRGRAATLEGKQGSLGSTVPR